MAEKYKIFCPVELGLSIVTRAKQLDNTKSEDALCVYKDKKVISSLLAGLNRRPFAYKANALPLS